MCVGLETYEVKTYDQSFQQRQNWQENREKAWNKLVVDRALEEDLSDIISDPNHYEDVWAEVHDAYLQMPSRESYTSIELHLNMLPRFYRETYTKKQREDIVKSWREEALDIMLARRGKVRYTTASHNCELVFLPPGYGKSSKWLWDSTFELWVYIRDELRRNGVPAQLIFQTGEMADFERTAYDADDVEKFHYMNGSLIWLPVTYFDDNLKYVSM